MKVRDTKILGTKISSINYVTALTYIEKRIALKKGGYICVSAVHLVMECFYDSILRAGVNRSLLTTPDGMPLVWISKLYGNNETSRVYGPTLMLKACQLAAKNKYSIFFLGGNKGQGKQLAQVLQKKFPKLSIVGWYETPVRPIPLKRNKKLIEYLQKVKPSIIFVGLGCPLQEKWMIENYAHLPTSILIGVGAAFNFITGHVQQAPIWMQNVGLEWLFRLSKEPNRLAHRYLVYNTQFIYQISKQFIRDSVSSLNQ